MATLLVTTCYELLAPGPKVLEADVMAIRRSASTWRAYIMVILPNDSSHLRHLIDRLQPMCKLVALAPTSLLANFSLRALFWCESDGQLIPPEGTEHLKALDHPQPRQHLILLA